MDTEGQRSGAGLLALLGSPESGEPPSSEGEAGEMPEAELVAASDVRDAMRAGSDEEFARALRRFVRICGYSQE